MKGQRRSECDLSVRIQDAFLLQSVELRQMLRQDYILNGAHHADICADQVLRFGYQHAFQRAGEQGHGYQGHCPKGDAQHCYQCALTTMQQIGPGSAKEEAKAHHSGCSHTGKPNKSGILPASVRRPSIR